MSKSDLSFFSPGIIYIVHVYNIVHVCKSKVSKFNRFLYAINSWCSLAWWLLWHFIDMALSCQSRKLFIHYLPPSPFLLFMMTVCYSMICVVLYDLLTNLGKSLLFLPKPCAVFLRALQHGNVSVSVQFIFHHQQHHQRHHFCTGSGAKIPLLFCVNPARFLWSLTCVLQWKQDWFD